jgi:hypothetical protein
MVGLAHRPAFARIDFFIGRHYRFCQSSSSRRRKSTGDVSAPAGTNQVTVST